MRQWKGNGGKLARMVWKCWWSHEKLHHHSSHFVSSISSDFLPVRSLSPSFSHWECVLWLENVKNLSHIFLPILHRSCLVLCNVVRQEKGTVRTVLWVTKEAAGVWVAFCCNGLLLLCAYLARRFFCSNFFFFDSIASYTLPSSVCMSPWGDFVQDAKNMI